jgi:hypothetical protein
VLAHVYVVYERVRDKQKQNANSTTQKASQADVECFRERVRPANLLTAIYLSKYLLTAECHSSLVTN